MTTVATTSASLNTTNITWLQRLTWFCGMPGFCDSDARQLCANIPISQCPTCSLGSGVFFLVLVFLLFVVIILGNASIMACFISSPTMRTKMDYVRLSLSVSDMLIGFQLIIVMIPNLIRTFGMTQNQLDEFTFLSADSLTTIICGCLYNLSFTSSMYHMVLLSGFRLMAVTQPLKYKLMRNRWVLVCISVVWVFSIFSAVIPTFPNTLSLYTYNQSAFIHLPSRAYALNAASRVNLVVIFSVALPYACVMIIIPLTVIILRVKRKKSEAILNQNQNNSQSYQQEMRIICTLSIMYFSYAASVLPLLIVLVLINQGSLSCSTMGITTMLTVFLAVGNSLVNVVVYGTRDKRFRKVLCQLLREKCPNSVCHQKKENPADLITSAAVVNRTEANTAL